MRHWHWSFIMPQQKTMLRRDIIEEFPGTPTSRPGFNRWRKKYGFPRPKYLNPNMPTWDRPEVEDWYANRPKTHAASLADSRG
jgi:predicted DNA-binding transcriptional regulator AlpA